MRRDRSGCPAAFLDRDGVLNEVVPDRRSQSYESPLTPEQVRLVPGAAAGARLLASAGFVLVEVSNQPAAAKGFVEVSRLLEVQARVEALLDDAGVHLAASHLCLHHPEGVVADLTGPCPCRKPEPGMLLQAAEELDLDLAQSWIFGDGSADVGAGRAAGCCVALIEHPRTAHRRVDPGEPDLCTADLAHAAEIVVGRTR